MNVVKLTIAGYVRAGAIESGYVACMLGHEIEEIDVTYYFEGAGIYSYEINMDLIQT